MNILVLRPGHQKLTFSYFSNGWDQPLCAGQMEDYRTGEGSQQALHEITEALRQNRATHPAGTPLRTEHPTPAGSVSSGESSGQPVLPDVIALRGIFGGTEFKEPTLVSPKVLRKLEKLVENAPLHIPALLALIQACQAAFVNTPIVLIFETAFFADLPEREHLYAVDPRLSKTRGVRRFGYHGILHAAACNHVARKRREMGHDSAARVLSICLEARPEVAAVLGQKPLLVTSGGTPLEGLPGQTTCGELDPGIVLMLAQKKGWGPEQLNAVLTQQSGWLGLVGRITTLAEIFGSHRPECELAKEIIQYRLLQVCGAGMAALGGVDAIVFSGRCSGVGAGLGVWLKKKLDFQQQGSLNPILIEICPETVDRVLAETACTALLGSKLAPRRKHGQVPINPAAS